MFLFNRTVTLEGNPRDTIPWALDMTTFVNEHTDLHVGLWSVMFGAPIGTMVFSTFVDSRAIFEASTRSLMTNDEYLAKIDQALEWTAAPPTDTLREVVHQGGGEYRRAEVGNAVQIITAEVAAGQYGYAMTWCAEITDLVSSITDVPALFLKDVYGQFGQVTWLASFTDLTEVDRAQEALNKDPDYLAKVDNGGELFIPGSGTQGLAQRIG